MCLKVLPTNKCTTCKRSVYVYSNQDFMYSYRLQELNISCRVTDYTPLTLHALMPNPYRLQVCFPKKFASYIHAIHRNLKVCPRRNYPLKQPKLN